MQGLSTLLFFAVFIGLFYFLFARPQKRRQLEMQNLQKNLKAGDEVVTLGGIYGTVTEIEEGGTVLIEISEDTEIRIAASSIGSIVPHHTPVAEAIEPPATAE